MSAGGAVIGRESIGEGPGDRGVSEEVAMNHKISTSDPMRHQDIEHYRLEQRHHRRLYSIEDEEMKERGEGGR
jgi:hypothetical protein